jgi:hypothetical protein
VLRQALFDWAFNPATRDIDPPPEITAALDWAERASLPVAEREDTATVRLALAACARTLTGKPAAGSATARTPKSGVEIAAGRRALWPGLVAHAGCASPGPRCGGWAWG